MSTRAASQVPLVESRRCKHYPVFEYSRIQTLRGQLSAARVSRDNPEGRSEKRGLARMARCFRCRPSETRVLRSRKRPQRSRSFSQRRCLKQSSEFRRAVRAQGAVRRVPRSGARASLAVEGRQAEGRTTQQQRDGEAGFRGASITTPRAAKRARQRRVYWTVNAGMPCSCQLITGAPKRGLAKHKYQSTSEKQSQTEFTTGRGKQKGGWLLGRPSLCAIWERARQRGCSVKARD